MLAPPPWGGTGVSRGQTYSWTLSLEGLTSLGMFGGWKKLSSMCGHLGALDQIPGTAWFPKGQLGMP